MGISATLGWILLFPSRVWPWDKWDEEVAFTGTILVAATQCDLDQGQQEVRGDRPVTRMPSFAVPWQFASQPSKWEHRVTRSGQHHPIWDGNLTEDTHVLYLSNATQQCYAEQCDTQAKETGELWGGLWFRR